MAYDYLINFLRLTRPLSNVKNIAIVIFALFLWGSEFNLSKILLGTVALSFLCSGIYAYNSLYDFKIDKSNKNKRHFAEAVQYFGNKKTLTIALTLIALGLVTGLFINVHFLLVQIFLLLSAFLYSCPCIFFKGKIILDVLFGAFFPFLFRFMAVWFLFSLSFPPLLAVFFLVFAKSAGYLLYKENDRQVLQTANIKNSITSLSKKTVMITSAFLFLLSFLSFLFLSLNGIYFKIASLGMLPIQFLFLTPLAFFAVLMSYLRVLNKINFKLGYLRILGFIYLLLLISIALKLFYE